MVQVRTFHSATEDRVNEADWLKRIQSDLKLDSAAAHQVEHACQVARHAAAEAGEIKPGYNAYYAGLEMAEILAELKLDPDALVAAILYRCVRERRLKLERVETVFGSSVARLIAGVQEMAAISASQPDSDTPILGDTQRQIENIRKMLVTLIDDVRVALIKLAERTWALRAVKNASQERRVKVAREVFEIYAPLAHRLGIGFIKWEMEDIAFRYLNPDDYKKIAKLLDERRVDRERYIQDVIEQLDKVLKEQGIKAVITGRAKHIYSIWRKMQRKNIEFGEVYDVRAVRVLVPELRDCYQALGLVHSLWRVVPNEFDDYIATPKLNGYRSLHTAVVGPAHKVLEVQIRTHEMHEEAEFGVCSHWRYKGTEGARSARGYEEKIEWLRQVLQWHEEVGDLVDLAEELKQDFEQDRVYVFTPAGHVVDLPNGATPVDFAYRVHTEIGHHCKGAIVNQHIVPLSYQLKTGDRVEIMTSEKAVPRRDWLNPALGFVHATRTRSKIQHWFKMQDKEINAQAGQEMVERELIRMALPLVDFEEMAPRVNYKTAEDMFAAVGAGDLRLSQITGLVQQKVEPHPSQLSFKISERSTEQVPARDLKIAGIDNLKSHIASCCKPVPGDECVGYVTLGRGISIHRSDCTNVTRLWQEEPERMIAVDWKGKAEGSYPVDILIQAFDRPGLLRDVTLVLANEKVNVTAVNSRTDDLNNWVDMMITMEVPDLDVLSRVMSRINRLPNMIEVKRYKPGG